jgi:hypothetical protein
MPSIRHCTRSGSSKSTIRYVVVDQACSVARMHAYQHRCCSLSIEKPPIAGQALFDYTIEADRQVLQHGPFEFRILTEPVCSRCMVASMCGTDARALDAITLPARKPNARSRALASNGARREQTPQAHTGSRQHHKHHKHHKHEQRC